MKLFALGLLAVIVASGSADHGGNHTTHDVRAPPQLHPVSDTPIAAPFDVSGSGDPVPVVTETSAPPVALDVTVPPASNTTTPGADT